MIFQTSLSIQRGIAISGIIIISLDIIPEIITDAANNKHIFPRRVSFLHTRRNKLVPHVPDSLNDRPGVMFLLMIIFVMNGRFNVVFSGDIQVILSTSSKTVIKIYTGK